MSRIAAADPHKTEQVNRKPPIEAVGGKPASEIAAKAKADPSQAAGEHDRFASKAARNKFAQEDASKHVTGQPQAAHQPTHEPGTKQTLADFLKDQDRRRV